MVGLRFLRVPSDAVDGAVKMEASTWLFQNRVTVVPGFNRETLVPCRKTRCGREVARSIPLLDTPTVDSWNWVRCCGAEKVIESIWKGDSAPRKLIIAGWIPPKTAGQSLFGRVFLGKPALKLAADYCRRFSGQQGKRAGC